MSFSVNITGKMSTFGGPKDEGVGAHEGLALIDPGDLIEWWFRRIFLPAQPVGTSGLARRLNPDAFYIAARWSNLDVPREVARRAIFRLTNPALGKSIFAQACDWGPAVWTHRDVDMSTGAANALVLKTDDPVAVEMIT